MQRGACALHVVEEKRVQRRCHTELGQGHLQHLARGLGVLERAVLTSVGITLAMLLSLEFGQL